MDAIGVPRENIMRQPIKVSGFDGDRTNILGFVNLDLIMWPIWAAHRFHVIDAQTAYHLLLRLPWIHRYKIVPFTYHQCLKAIWKERWVHIIATESPFQGDEAHVFDAQYFDELAKEGEVAISWPQGAFTNLGRLRRHELDPNNFAYTSTFHPRPSKQSRPHSKMISRKDLSSRWLNGLCFVTVHGTRFFSGI